MIKRALFVICLFFLQSYRLLAQSHSNSPYSDQAYDPVDNPEWYETPFLWIGIIIILGLVFFWLNRKGKRSNTRRYF